MGTGRLVDGTYRIALAGTDPAAVMARLAAAAAPARIELARPARGCLRPNCCGAVDSEAASQALRASVTAADLRSTGMKQSVRRPGLYREFLRRS